MMQAVTAPSDPTDPAGPAEPTGPSGPPDPLAKYLDKRPPGSTPEPLAARPASGRAAPCGAFAEPDQLAPRTP